jgi:hypothetical protein
MKVRNWREKCKERNRKAGQYPQRVVAPVEEEDEEVFSNVTLICVELQCK